MPPNQIIKFLEYSIRILLLLMFFWIPYSSAAVEVCVVLSVLLWIVKALIARDFMLPASPINRPVLIFLIVCIFSTAGSFFWERSLQGLITKTLEWFLIFWLTVDAFRKREHLKWAVLVILFSAASTSVDAIVQFHGVGREIFFGHLVATEGRATGPFKTANSLAGYLILLLPLLFSLFSAASSKKEQWFFGSLFLLFAWALAITYSRAAWMAALVGVGTVLFFQKRKSAAAWLAVGTVVLIFGMLEFHSHPEANLRLRSEQILGAWQWRWGLWQDAGQMISTRPFFGHGVNTFMLIFQEFRRKFNQAYDYDPTFAHNCYIQMAAETGILGLMAFLWIVFLLLSSGWKISKQQGTQEYWPAVLTGLSGGLLAFLLHCGMDTNLYSLKLSALFWACAGLAMSLLNLLNERAVHAIKRARYLNI